MPMALRVRMQFRHFAANLLSGGVRSKVMPFRAAEIPGTRRALDCSRWERMVRSISPQTSFYQTPIGDEGQSASGAVCVNVMR